MKPPATAISPMIETATFRPVDDPPPELEDPATAPRLIVVDVVDDVDDVDGDVDEVVLPGVLVVGTGT